MPDLTAATRFLESYVRGIQSAIRELSRANAHYLAAYDLGVEFWPAPDGTGTYAQAKKAVRSELRKLSVVFGIINRSFGRIWFSLEALYAHDPSLTPKLDRDEVLRLWTLVGSARKEVRIEGKALARVAVQLKRWKKRLDRDSDTLSSVPCRKALEVLVPCLDHVSKCFAALTATGISLDNATESGRQTIKALFDSLPAAAAYAKMISAGARGNPAPACSYDLKHPVG